LWIAHNDHPGPVATWPAVICQGCGQPEVEVISKKAGFRPTINCTDAIFGGLVYGTRMAWKKNIEPAICQKSG
jgi:hypothetical protein